VARGEIRYLQVPASDRAVSAAFYERALGWGSRTRPDGSTAFDDTSGVVSGELVTDRRPAGDGTGVLVYVRVDDVESSLAGIVDAGGEVVLPRTLEGESLVYATFRDPAGNELGIFQEGGR
jgi:predicted enzyme related to lactoylglutathione lyase